MSLHRMSGWMILLLAACQPSAPGNESEISANLPGELAEHPAPIEDAVRPDSTDATEQARPPAPAAPQAGQPEASLPEAPIEAGSAQAAGQVVQRYGALLEERRFAAARRLWSDSGRASGLSEAEFAAAYDKYAAVHATVGAPGDTEGAAGSIYVEVPMTLSGTLKAGGAFRLAGPVTLRRVNNVPGSTAEQRRWHISASGLKPRP